MSSRSPSTPPDDILSRNAVHEVDPTSANCTGSDPLLELESGHSFCRTGTPAQDVAQGAEARRVPAPTATATQAPELLPDGG